MPRPTPVHERSSARCTSSLWKEWAGCLAVRRYGTDLTGEYVALRHAAGMIDVSPLHKYDLVGSDAARFLSWLTVKDAGRLRPGRVTYLCWCDDDGKVLDDGTLARLDETRFRLTAAEPAFAWLARNAARFDVDVADRSRDLAALSVQGPGARRVLAATGAAVDGLRYFRIVATTIGGRPVEISRTGYTGDLGYEVWIDGSEATAVWDAIEHVGRPHGLRPVGLDAMDVTRIEAGFVLNGVDYFGADACAVESRKATPFEIGLGRTVELDRDAFVGRPALVVAEAAGPGRTLVGLELDWDAYEALFDELDLPADVPAEAWRGGRPVYDGSGRQVGHATSGTWSPTLKRNIALASVRADHGATGTELRAEVTVEFRRRSVPARVVARPFFDPPRKRA